jgi:predicted helicase
LIENRVICISGTGARSGFSVLITDLIPNYDNLEKGQCFPLKLYEPAINADDGHTPSGAKPQADLFSTDQIGLTVDVFEQVADQPRYTVKDGITDAGLAHFQAAYPDEIISKEDLFYYIYGLLHSEDYKSRYADNLTKELPRIPCVNKAADFWAFSQAGRALAELHIHYETVAPYPVTLECGAAAFDDLKDTDFYVTQMKFVKKGDKSKVAYNHKIIMTDIPVAAYDYVVNGKPALEWVMERQAVSTHKDSGIKNDANDWAIETMGNPRYPLELFQRVITVSLETMKIVNALPPLAITVK